MAILRIDSLGITVSSKVPTALVGPPGIGKTSAISAMERKDFPVELLTASLCTNGEIGGMLWAKEDAEIGVPIAQRIIPEWFSRLCRAGKGILFLDELSTAPPAVRATALRLICNRAIENIYLPEDVFVICAFNLPEHVSTCYELDGAMANRLRHVNINPDGQAWAKGAITNWGRPSQSSRSVGERQSLALVAGYIQKNPTALYDFPKDESKRSKPWPSPRSWELAAFQHAAEMQAGNSADAAVEAMSQIIGIGPAAAFSAYNRELDLPDPEELLNDKTAVNRWKPGNRTDIVFAVYGSIIASLTNNNTLERWQNACRVITAKHITHDDVLAAVAPAIMGLRDPKWPLSLGDLGSKHEFLKRAGLIRDTK